MNVSCQFFFLAVVLLVFILAILMAGHVHNQTQFRKSSSKFIFQYFHYFFIMPPTPKSAKMSGCWELGGTTFEKRHLYLCTKKFGASNLSQFWRLKALFIIILALNALCIVSFGAEGALYCVSNFDLGESKQYCSCN